MSVPIKEIKRLYETGLYNTIEYHEERISEQEEIAKISEDKLKKAIEKLKAIEDAQKELDIIKKELKELLTLKNIKI